LFLTFFLSFFRSFDYIDIICSIFLLSCSHIHTWTTLWSHISFNPLTPKDL
jgi:hypothetical protein